jgi:hypothetical protein
VSNDSIFSEPRPEQWVTNGEWIDEPPVAEQSNKNSHQPSSTNIFLTSYFYLYCVINFLYFRYCKRHWFLIGTKYFRFKNTKIFLALYPHTVIYISWYPLDSHVKGVSHLFAHYEHVDQHATRVFNNLIWICSQHRTAYLDVIPHGEVGRRNHWILCDFCHQLTGNSNHACT